MSPGLLKVLGKSVKVWTFDQLERMSVDNLRKIYRPLRNESRKRLNAYAESSFNQSPYYLSNLGEYDQNPSYLRKNELIENIYNSQEFLSEPYSDVIAYGQAKEKAIQTFKYHGYDWINEQNFEDFGKYMDFARRSSGIDFDSDRAVRLYKLSKEKGIPPSILKRRFNIFMKNYYSLESVPPKPQGITPYRYFEKLKFNR